MSTGASCTHGTVPPAEKAELPRRAQSSRATGSVQEQTTPGTCPRVSPSHYRANTLEINNELRLQDQWPAPSGATLEAGTPVSPASQRARRKRGAHHRSGFPHFQWAHVLTLHWQCQVGARTVSPASPSLSWGGTACGLDLGRLPPHSSQESYVSAALSHTPNLIPQCLHTA